MWFCVHYPQLVFYVQHTCILLGITALRFGPLSVVVSFTNYLIQLLRLQYPTWDPETKVHQLNTLPATNQQPINNQRNQQIGRIQGNQQNCILPSNHIIEKQNSPVTNRNQLNNVGLMLTYFTTHLATHLATQSTIKDITTKETDPL